jgi:type I restriction enzyme S subunit
MVLRPLTDVISSKLFPFFVSSNHFLDEAIKISVGSLSPTINWRDLKDLEFNIPPIEKQDVLADELWAMEETKEAYNQLLIATDALVKSQFIEMFENEKINIKWDSVKLSELFELQMGKTPSRSNSYYWDSEDFRWISIADLSNYSKYTADTKEKISKLAVEKTGIKQIPKDTLIMSFKLTIGKTAITSEPIYTNEAIMAFIDKRSADFSIEYLNTMLSYMNWDKVSKQAVKGATLNKATIGSVKITVPPIELQNQFAVFIEQIDKSKFALLQNIEKLEQCRNALMQKSFG